MKEDLSAITGAAAGWSWSTRGDRDRARCSSTSPVRPDGDAWLLLSLLHVVFAEGLDGRARDRAQATGVGALRSAAAAYPPEATRRSPASEPRRRARWRRDWRPPERGGVRPHRLVPGPPRDARRLPDGRADAGDRQPRPRGRQRLRRARIPLEDGGELPGRGRTTGAAPGSAASPTCWAHGPATLMAKEIRRRAGPAAGAVRHRRQPGAVGAEQRGAAAALSSSTCWSRSTSTSTRPTGTPTTSCPTTTCLEREDVPFASLPSSPRRSSRAPRRSSRRTARRGRSGGSSRTSSSGWGSRCSRRGCCRRGSCPPLEPCRGRSRPRRDAGCRWR